MAGCSIHRRYNFLVLAAVVLLALTDRVNAAIENVARGKNATMSATYANGTASSANDGNRDNSSLDLCATVTRTRNISNSLAWWMVDLGDMFIIYSVTLYSSAVLPDSTFSRDLRIVLHNSPSYSDLPTITYDIPPGGNYTVTFTARNARFVTVYRNYNHGYNDMALCELEVMGSPVQVAPEAEISQNKPTNQSNTYSGRSSHFAVDGDRDQTNLDKCATAYTTTTSTAWWQVDLGEIYIVNTVDMYFPTVYFPTVGRDQKYMDAFDVSVSIDANRNYQISCGSTLYIPYSSTWPNGTASVNCTADLVVGRYVNIVKYTGYQYSSILTVCEVVVRGVRQNVSADDKGLDIFKPVSASSTTTTVTETESTYRSLAIAAIVIASAFALFSLIMLAVCIVVIRGHGRMEKHDKAAAATKPNKYVDTDVSKHQPQRNEMPLPPRPGEDDDYVEYDDISPTQSHANNGQKPRR